MRVNRFSCLPHAHLVCDLPCNALLPLRGGSVEGRLLSLYVLIMLPVDSAAAGVQVLHERAGQHRSQLGRHSLGVYPAPRPFSCFEANIETARCPSAPTDPNQCASLEFLFCRLQVVDTFQIQDVDGEIVQPIKSSCYAYGGTCKVQALKPSDGSIVMLTFNSYDILARADVTQLPVPLDSTVLDGAVGGFATVGLNSIYYGSGALGLLPFFLSC